MHALLYMRLSFSVTHGLDRFGLVNQTLSPGWCLLIEDYKHPLRKGLEHTITSFVQQIYLQQGLSPAKCLQCPAIKNAEPISLYKYMGPL